MMDEREHRNQFDEGIEEDRPSLERLKTESSAEFVEPTIDTDNPDDTQDQDITNIYGWIAVALSVIAFFMTPVLFAAGGIILGFVARNKDAPVLGNTAIGISIVALIARFIIIPFI